MEDQNATAVAKDMLATFGPGALSVVESRIRESARDGKSCGVEFWSEVGAAVKDLTGKEQSA